jgi:hypothetical protein
MAAPRPLRHPAVRSVLPGALAGLQVLAVDILIPNGSFELPKTDYVNTRIASWQETDQPPDYPSGGGFSWDQLSGVFHNTPPGASDHLTNLDGQQALYLFAIPGAGILQDDTTRDWDDPEPSHAFSIPFEPGSRYTLTVGLMGGSGNMLTGVPLEISLYHRGADGGILPVITRRVEHSPEIFTDRNHFVDFSVSTDPVTPTDPWAHKPIGVRILSTVSDAQRGGYWDIDNVRLTREIVPEPRVEVRATWEGTPTALTLRWGSQPGYTYRVLTSTDMTQWIPASDGLPGTGGDLSWQLPNPDSNRGFVRIEALR